MDVDFAGMVNRMIRAAMLDVQLFEEVEHDPSKDQEALVAVIAVALINAILSFPMSLMRGHGFVRSVAILIFSLVWTVIGYYIYAYLAYLVGTNVFQGTADAGELRRVLGYAYAPMIFSWIPCLGPVVAGLWMIATGVVAIRQALDVDTTRAVLTAIIAIVIIFVLYAILAGILGLGLLGFGALAG